MLYYVQTKPMGVPDIPAHGGARRLYKTPKEQQLTFDGFNHSCGMKLNPKDEHVILADMIDWAAVEAEYSALFKSKRGRPAASARMALGSLVIQKRANPGDRKLVKEIARNASYQYFLGLQSFQRTSPIKHGVLPEFRKRLGKDFLVRVNEIFLKKANSTHAHAEDKPESPAANGNMGTMILDATCSPSNIRFPQDFSPLNEARVKLDAMIDKLHDPASGKRRPRTYRKVLRKKCLAHVKSRKRTAKQARSIIWVMLCAVKRNMAFVDGFLEKGGFLEDRDMEPLAAIRKLHAQQKEMFDEKRHRVAERIVGVTQPYVRPIVRGKVKDPVEFGRSTTSASTNAATLGWSTSIPWTRPTVCRRVICWKSRTRRHDGLGRRHPQATHGRRAARNPAPAAGSRPLWADTR